MGLPKTIHAWKFENPRLKLSRDGSLPVGGFLQGSWWDWGGGGDRDAGLWEVEMGQGVLGGRGESHPCLNGS